MSNYERLIAELYPSTETLILVTIAGLTIGTMAGLMAVRRMREKSFFCLPWLSLVFYCGYEAGSHAAKLLKVILIWLR